ncbi:MAG: hypothetical protein KAU50_03520, partial [Candidatus Marinimicrobia bacterium]|nr:hypothetical protein [Candidatus Neomarinimicrobiota bacterium]
MPIVAPTNLKIYAPALNPSLDLTAEPTLEGLAGTDIMGNAIAAGGQAVNVVDGYPNRPVTVTTGTPSPPSSSSFRIDAALNRRRTIDAVIMDGHNLLSAYPEALRQQMDVLHHTADNVGAATQVVPTKIISGLLGKRRPRVHLNGTTSDYISAPNNADTNFGAGSWTLFFYGDHTAGAFFSNKGGMSAAAGVIFAIVSGQLRYSLGDGANQRSPGVTVDASAGRHLWALVLDRATEDIFIGEDGVLVWTDTVGSAAIGDIDNAAAWNIGRETDGGNPYDGEIFLYGFANRAISA